MLAAVWMNPQPPFCLLPAEVCRPCSVPPLLAQRTQLQLHSLISELNVMAKLPQKIRSVLICGCRHWGQANSFQRMGAGATYQPREEAATWVFSNNPLFQQFHFFPAIPLNGDFITLFSQPLLIQPGFLPFYWHCLTTLLLVKTCQCTELRNELSLFHPPFLFGFWAF